MAQPLKIINFETEQSAVDEENQNKKNSLSGSSILATLRLTAIVTAIFGVLSLVFEVRLYHKFIYEIYLARLFPTIFSFLTLILIQTHFGRKNKTTLAHFYIAQIILSLSFVVYKIPSLYLFNIFGALLFVLTISIFLGWGIRNQVIVTSYFLLFLGMSLILSNVLDYTNPNTYLLLTATASILFVSALASRNKINVKPENKSVDENNKIKPLEGEGILMEESIVPLFQIDMEGNFIYGNKSFLDNMNIEDRVKFEKMNFFDDFVANANIKKHILQKLKTKNKVEKYRLKIAGENQKTKIMTVDCQLIISESSSIIEGTIRNITDQYIKEKNLNSELDNLKKTKRTIPEAISNIESEPPPKLNIISNMGHELRTPMNSVLGFLTLIENGHFENNEELKEFSSSAKFSAESLLRILNDLVEISKIEEGLLEIENNNFNLSENVEKVIEDLTQNLQQKGLTISCDISEDIPESIFSDSYKYSQILTNLLVNAIQVSESGDILVSVYSTEHNNKMYLNTKVTDTGKGIDGELLKNIFEEKFYKLNNKSKSNTSILNLIICNELINILNGKIYSASENKLSNTIEFSIELKSTAKTKEINSVGEFELDSYNKSKLLLVEDNPISRKVEQKLLQKAGYDVDCVDNGTDAIKSVEKGIYNLVLMDIELKDINGLEATKKIRSLADKVNNIPIIAVTAHSSMKDREKCLLVGMNDYISKPININFLKMTIDQWLSAAQNS